MPWSANLNDKSLHAFLAGEPAVKSRVADQSWRINGYLTAGHARLPRGELKPYLPFYLPKGSPTPEWTLTQYRALLQKVEVKIVFLDVSSPPRPVQTKLAEQVNGREIIGVGVLPDGTPADAMLVKSASELVADGFLNKSLVSDPTNPAMFFFYTPAEPQGIGAVFHDDQGNDRRVGFAQVEQPMFPNIDSPTFYPAKVWLPQLEEPDRSLLIGRGEDGIDEQRLLPALGDYRNVLDGKTVADARQWLEEKELGTVPAVDGIRLSAVADQFCHSGS